MGRAALAVIPDADQLPEGDKRGRRYQRAEREAAFHLYASLTPPSLARAAALLSIAESTIKAWSSEDRWQDRLSDRVGPVDAAVQSTDIIASRLIANGQIPSLVAIHEIIADREHRDRLDAAVTMRAYGGHPVPKGSTATQTLNPDGTSSVTLKVDLAALTPEQRRLVREHGIAALDAPPPLALPDDADGE